MPKKYNTTNKTISKELVNPLSKEEVKERISRANYYEEHPDRIYGKLGELLTKSDISKWTKEEEDYLNKYVRNIDNFSKSHIGLAETQGDGNLRTTVVELANNLINEYDCNTTLEKTLCEVVGNSYGKVMQLSKKFTNVMLGGEYITDERTRYLSMIGKELDRANRSYLIALNNLIELKRPQMNINVKTKNAYFGQNQQFNNNKTDNENIND